MLNYNPLHCFPSSEELPDSDDTPVDNELQDLIPGLLKATLALMWSERWDWFFGVDMGIYYDPNKPAIVPDGFLSLNVKRFIDDNLRYSYVLWEEQEIPTITLEVISHIDRGEYTTKKDFYRQLGILYYIIYNPERKRKAKFEVYKLENGDYNLISKNPVWLPEVGLGIGVERGIYQGIAREWIYWYNENGQRTLTAEEQSQQAQQQLFQVQQQLSATQKLLETEQRRSEAERTAQLLAERKAQLLAEKLRTLGIDPDTLDYLS